MNEQEVEIYYNELHQTYGTCSECGNPLCSCGLCHSCEDLGSFELNEKIFEKEE